EMTVLFADLEAFTGLAEALGPERTFEFLNSYYAGLAPRIQEHGGVVDKYLGDGVMVLFPRGPQSAVDAALSMLRWTREFNEAGAWPRVARLGIGVASGAVVLGMLGSDARLDWTVVADCVNVASRLERLTRQLRVDLLVSDTVHAALVPETARWSRPLGRVRVRGKEAALSVFEVFAGEDEATRLRKASTVGALQTICEQIESGARLDALARLETLRARVPEDLALLGIERRWGADGGAEDPA
ncbi:MAG: adenylate/guanylate cyclase domain-containing protein, partial [Myxococcales bacterium]|nr:adenylate/guanylate cyclase domain-containing protein [Myxococcales bacterium]